jgi:CBS-domain-containing membrane protein
MALDPLIINRDDIAKRTRCSLSHGGSFLLSWLRLATTSSARFGAASPTYLCERFCTSSEELKVRRLPVINKSKRMVGILSLGDVSRSATAELLSECIRSVSAHH